MTSGTLGIVDVGTNSIHLIIGRAAQGRFRVLAQERTLAKLGEGGLRRNRLTAAAMHGAEWVLRRYAAILDRSGTERIEAVATSAVRDAANGRAFIRRVRARCGLPLRVISGREEARLIYLGAWRARRWRANTVVLSIGGGSAQVTCGTGRRVAYAVSLPLGASRLTERFIRHDPASPQEVRALHAHLRQAWQAPARRVRRWRASSSLGCSSMIDQVAVAHARGGRVGSGTITRQGLAPFVAWVACSTAQARRRIPGIDRSRQELLLASSLALMTWMEACGIERLVSAPGSLREGLVVDYLR